MSEQNKSNFQALGAGLIGFVAVTAVGGGLLMFQSSRQAKSTAAPAPAAAPIDLGSTMPRPSTQEAPVRSERRAHSPAPLIGDVDEPAADEASAEASSPAASAASAAASLSPEAAPSAKGPALDVARHLDVEAGASSAKAIVKNTAEAKKAALPGKKAPAPKLEVPAGDGAVASSVHYGVTSRSELMGRAAGPVYNIKGAKGGGGSAATGKLADDADGKLADIRRQLEVSGLPDDQRAKLLKDLDVATKRIEAAGKTAQ
ncbi:MAG: hypothetical protein NDJ72_01380 [Elusimicrobia bacterium]|nr:hypothetical protein [Elusimicrobiota bacterium]